MKIGEQTIVFLAVNKNGDEVILNNAPARQGEIWTDERSPEKKDSSPTPIRRRRKTSGVSIWMWMILCINIITDNENKKDRMTISYPSIIM